MFEGEELSHEDFTEFMMQVIEQNDLVDTSTEREMLKPLFKAVFEIFDSDRSGKLDMCEVANCLAILCGGSINDKIYAAFNLFDENNSMTLSFDELNKFIKCVFTMFYFIQAQPDHAPKNKVIWNEVEMEKLCLATTNKCFDDNHVVKGKGEINYTQFVQWMTGQSLLD